MGPFESTYVSTFVFAMGYIVRDNNMNLADASASGFAQCKADETIGDLVLRWPGRKFIFEFKRNLASMPTEFQKPHKVALLKELEKPEQKRNRCRAQRGHFLAYGLPGDSDGLRFVQYTSINKEGRRPDDGLAMNAFIRRIIFSPDWGLGEQAFGEYVALLHKCSRPSAGARSTSSKSAVPDIEVLVVSYDQATHNLRFATVDLIMDRTIRVERDQAIELGRPFARGRPRESEIER